MLSNSFKTHTIQCMTEANSKFPTYWNPALGLHASQPCPQDSLNFWHQKNIQIQVQREQIKGLQNSSIKKFLIKAKLNN